MAARRCSIDGISYPADYSFNKCLICGETTSYIQADPDEDWEFKVALLSEHLEQAATERPEIPVVDVPVQYHQGAYFIHAWELYHAGHRDPLLPSALIQVGKQVFETIGYSKEQRMYLVRPFSLELSNDDLRRLVDG